MTLKFTTIQRNNDSRIHQRVTSRIRQTTNFL